MISRRLLMGSIPVLAVGHSALALGTSADAVIPMSAENRLDTIIRMRGRTDGRLCAGWLDAVRYTVIDGDVAPFCRILAGTISRFEKHGDEYEANVMEVAYYLDPKTGALLDTFKFPGATEAVKVPTYRTGPAKRRFAVARDEWENVQPGTRGQPSSKFAPKSAAHLQSSIGIPTLDRGSVYIRADEYGQVYPDRSAPPTVFYREWMIWRAAARDVLESRLPDIPADFMYSALSSWRPWMKMGDIKGHTAENGRGEKVRSPSEFPLELRKLVAANDPHLLNEPERALDQPPPS